ncbi:carbohydrate binding domain-containing protein [Hymenobacter convexus]|uniref:carbohydrate binding domain-containing protein n=1 Tax=Hymenobacter sp. CA1UV-4 TaxID=3063782 RepID=UPI0027141516|nr:carbohydrate binding domain-containing protein [Hymenobacter sp. CA1UV-4]MDO7850769.1 hypothetical protein [Hymenobacter sp. CA1UV-4]
MPRYFTLAAALLALSLSGCSDKSQSDAEAGLLTSNDFEHLNGWSDSPSMATLTTEKAHSGQYSVVVKPGADYGLGYGNLLSKLSASRPNKITVSAWVFLPSNQAPAVLVTQITEPATNKVYLWDGMQLVKEVKKFNVWQKVEKTITVPAEATATSRIQIYPWRGDSTQPVYLDDVEVKLAK